MSHVDTLEAIPIKENRLCKFLEARIWCEFKKQQEDQ